MHASDIRISAGTRGFGIAPKAQTFQFLTISAAIFSTTYEISKTHRHYYDCRHRRHKAHGSKPCVELIFVIQLTHSSVDLGPKRILGIKFLYYGQVQIREFIISAQHLDIA